MIAQAAALRSLRTTNFALLWSAQLVSGFGDEVTVVALAFVTWQITHSALSTVVAILLTTVPYGLFYFIGGAVADALGHLRAMIACDLIRVVAIGTIPAVLAVGAPLPVAYALVLVAAVCATIFNPARLGLVPELVPPEELTAGNSMVYASDRTVDIAGAAAAGVVVAALGTAAFYVDAATFVVSAALLTRIAVAPTPLRPLHVARIAREAADAVRFLAHNAVLRANVVFSLLGQLSIPVLNGLTPVLIFRDYGLGAGQFGIAEAAVAAGAVAGGVALPSFLRRLPKGRLLILGFAAFGAMLVAIAAAPTFEVAMLLFVVAGVANVLFYVPNVTITQELAPSEMRARVFGVRLSLLNLTWLPIVIGIGVAADFESAKALLALAGGFTLLVAVAGSVIPIVRDVE
ncbi:MAG: MFS transporter [Chloroflexota bacterium]|nr:MFS transporter [Chloroflexota bacterium]